MSMDNDLAIKTNNLTKEFGGRIAVKNLNIEIKRGEVFSLLGTNGAGKTTTIKMLCCLIRPSSGNAEIMGHDTILKQQEIKQIIGVSPQETAIAEHLTTLENLLLMGGVYGINRRESLNRAKKMMKMMGLEDRKDQSRRLSGGVQRRLSIAMALMSDPRILFLDEPTLGLDPHARKSVWDYIEKLKEEKTILLTTHYLEEADTLADNIAILDKGKVIEYGTPVELKNRHSNERSIIIRSDNVSDEVIALLKKKGAMAIKTNYGLILKDQKGSLDSIIDLLRRNNVSIMGMDVKETSLEEVFIKLTKNNSI